MISMAGFYEIQDKGRGNEAGWTGPGVGGETSCREEAGLGGRVKGWDERGGGKQRMGRKRRRRDCEQHLVEG